VRGFALLAVGLVLLAVTVALVVRQLAPQREEVAGRPDVVRVRSHADLAVAVRQAQDRLDEFIERLQNPQPGDAQFGVNARINTPDGPEQVWVSVHEYREGRFLGELHSEPAAADLRKGDPIEIRREDVMDWAYFHEGERVGGFTLDVLGGR
jgi:uncharacterized protein YegJ (DUF2314 family)